MDDTTVMPHIVRPTPTEKRGWKAALTLRFSERLGRSYLAHRLHKGPLVMQKTLHPEGDSVCHGIVVHPPGGVAGGDTLHLDVHVEAQSHALLTTPGAGKWYKANGLSAQQELSVRLETGGSLEWFPQENILFDGANVQFSSTIQLEGSATFAGWDIVCLGRQAQQEQWRTGRLLQHQRVFRDGSPIWVERSFFTPEHLVLRSGVGLGGRLVFGTFIIAHSGLPAEALTACRALVPVGLTAGTDTEARVGLTVLPDVVVVRYVGNASQSVRHYFEQIWHILRPWYLNKTAVRPRIWNT